MQDAPGVDTREETVEDILRMRELLPALNEGHRMQLLVLAETFTAWESRYDYGE